MNKPSWLDALDQSRTYKAAPRAERRLTVTDVHARMRAMKVDEEIVVPYDRSFSVGTMNRQTDGRYTGRKVGDSLVIRRIG